MTEETPVSSPEDTQPSKTYDPKNVEAKWYDAWEKAGYLQPSPEGKPYSIVIPPPNVTGSLHMGHALNSTLQDVIIRYKKLRGYSTLWVPGTDHGGIATQNVVERLLKKEGMTRHSLGREKFLERMWTWRKESGDTILTQLRTLGATLDWTRMRFTMDDVCSKAVRKAFVELYDKKLLYRGKRLVNWCPRCGTALADIEVEHKDSQGSLWHIRYPIMDRRKGGRTGTKKKPETSGLFDQGYVVVATTRPETMLGDTAVAVHPKDKRYRALHGVHVKLPLTNRLIPIVADDIVDKSFGSGAVKVTPAHDPVDFEIAARRSLPHISVIGQDGTMTEDAGAPYAGLDRDEARKKVVEDLTAQGLLEKVEPYKVALSVCYRCDSVIEPLESEQWFLSMKDMAKKARDANKKGKVRIVPDSWENPYHLWLKNIRDWCVSRQNWWGHRIPVWYCASEKTPPCPPIVSMENPTVCPSCGNSALVQDEDVLDTWFSSALWPFSVFGWPDETADLKKFFPTATLVTGHEILYLWVARMIMFSLEFTGHVPFHTVLIHGIVRDKQGRKMSKSLGNVIDPLDLIRTYGADAVRFSLAQSAAPGRDMHISPDNFLGARNFSNKIWNATRFALMNLAGVTSVELPPKESWELADRWILHRFGEVITQVTGYMDHFDLDAAARLLYDFFWSDFCDWYVEMVKPRLQGESAPSNGLKSSKETAQAVVATVLEGTLRLLHPFMPFITEELWQKIPKPKGVKAVHLMAHEWAVPEPHYSSPEAAGDISIMKEIVTKLRAIRSEMGIPPTQQIKVLAEVTDPRLRDLLKVQEGILKSLNSRVGEFVMAESLERPKGSAAAVIPGASFYVPLEGLIDFEKERARLEKELLGLKNDIERVTKKLSNRDFITNAPEEEVEKTRQRLSDGQERVTRLQENIHTLDE